jgi:hypothetical protein
MSIYGKKPLEYVKFAQTGMILIILMGLTRFFVGISGVPFERATQLVSLTNLTLVLFIVYGYRVAASHFGTYRHLLPTAMALTVPMYSFIVVAILIEGLGGFQGYFHFHSLHALGGQLPPQLMGLIDIHALMNVPTHIFGQIVGWVFFTLLGWGVASLGFLMSRYLGFLRTAFLVLVCAGVLRLLLGATGVPHAIGNWLSSLTLVVMALSLYYGYSAPSNGFHRYWQVLFIALPLSVVFNLVVIAGMLISLNLGLANYFNPDGVSVGQHILGHLALALVGTIPLAIFAGVGFALGRRKPALTSQPAH